MSSSGWRKKSEIHSSSPSSTSYDAKSSINNNNNNTRKTSNNNTSNKTNKKKTSISSSPNLSSSQEKKSSKSNKTTKPKKKALALISSSQENDTTPTKTNNNSNFNNNNNNINSTPEQYSPSIIGTRKFSASLESNTSNSSSSNNKSRPTTASTGKSKYYTINSTSSSDDSDKESTIVNTKSRSLSKNSNGANGGSSSLKKRKRVSPQKKRKVITSDNEEENSDENNDLSDSELTFLLDSLDNEDFDLLNSKNTTNNKKKKKKQVIEVKSSSSDDQEEDEEDLKRMNKQKKKKKSNSSSITSNNRKIDVSNATQLDEDWCHLYTPKDFNDFIISQKTIQKVEQWISSDTNNLKNNYRNNKFYSCIVIGPGGSGKRSLIYHLLNKYNYKINIYHNQSSNKQLNNNNNSIDIFRKLDESEFLDDWINTNNNNYHKKIVKYYERGGNDTIFSKGPNTLQTINNFKEFLKTFISKKTLNLISSNDNNNMNKSNNRNVNNNEITKEVIVVDELPPCYSKLQKEKLFQILNDSLQMIKQTNNNNNKRIIRLIIIQDHSSNTNADYDLLINFPNDFVMTSEILKFNAFTTKMIEKKLKNICDLQRIDFSDQVLNEIAIGSHGDLRHAICQLQFYTFSKKKSNSIHSFFNNNNSNNNKSSIVTDIATINNHDELKKKARAEAKRILQKRKNNNNNNLNNNKTCKTNTSFRDIGTTIHHAVGRILYGKRLKNGKIEFDLERDVMNLYKNNNNTSNYNTSEKMLTNYIHANAPSFCNDIQKLSESLDSFSLVDSIYSKRIDTSNYEDLQQTTTFSQYYFLIPSLSVLYHHQGNIPKVEGGLKKITAPKLMKVFFQQREEQFRQLKFLFEFVNLETNVFGKQLQFDNNHQQQLMRIGELPLNYCHNFMAHKDLFETNIPYLTLMKDDLTKQNRKFSWPASFSSRFHQYPIRGSDVNRKLVNSTDEIELESTENEETVDYSNLNNISTTRNNTTLDSSVVSSVLTSLNPLLFGKNDDEIIVNSNIPKDDEIEND
ncbi:hypothetical protein ABK040_002063 [Willaertia magna]